MKKLFYLLVLLLLTFACFNQKSEKKEITFLNAAVKVAKTENKLLIIEFWAPECGPCIRLKHDIFDNEETRSFLNDNFHMVQVSPADSVYNPLWKFFRLAYQSSVIIMDKNGNEIDRTVSYDGNRDAYINFLKDVSVGKNMYIEVFEAYKKDTMNVPANYLLAKKLLFRYQMNDAVKLFKKVVLKDPGNKFGFNQECKYKIAECEFLLNGNLDKLREFTMTDIKNEYVPKAYEYLINDLINKKDQNSCISLCREALTKYPDSWEILNKYAWAICTFKIKEDFKNALGMAQKSIALNPYRSGTYSTEAWIHYEMGEKDKAIQLQNQAIEIYPNPSYFQDLEKFKSN